MRRLRKIVWIVPTVSIWVCAPAEACSVQIHYSKSQIEAAHIAAVRARRETLGSGIPPHSIGSIRSWVNCSRIKESMTTSSQNWDSHPDRFEHQHSFVWRVLDGDMLYHEKHPFGPAISPSTANILPLEVGGQGNPGNLHGVPQPSGGSAIASVPEPSAGVLMLSALIAGLLGAASRRIVGRLRRRRASLDRPMRPPEGHRHSSSRSRELFRHDAASLFGTVCVVVRAA